MENLKKIKKDKIEEINTLLLKYENAVNEYIDLLLEELSQDILSLEETVMKTKEFRKKFKN